MGKTGVGPSKLHLKKDIAGLGKAQFLQEPRILSSSRPYSNFGSTSAACFIHENAAEGNFAGSYDSTWSHTPIEHRRKYLRKRRNHSSKSGDSTIKEDDDRQESLLESSEDGSSNYIRSRKFEESLSDLMHFNAVRQKNQEMSERRKLRRMYRSTMLKAQSLNLYNFTEHLRTKEYSNSKEFEQTRHSRRDKASHSYTPNSSYGCLDETSVSLDGMYQLQKRRNQGWRSNHHSARPKDGGCGSCFSPSVIDTPRSFVSKIHCKRRKSNKKRSSHSYKQKFLLQHYQSGPPLDDSYNGAGLSADQEGNELTHRFQELNLEALSHLDGRKSLDLSNRVQPKQSHSGRRSWPNSISQEHLELIATRGSGSEMMDNRSLFEKYRPLSFDEIICQDFVVQSLKNAILKGKIASSYMFQGPYGTGKTSVARIFAASLSCLSTKDNQPCGLCDACTDILCRKNGSSSIELSTSNKKGMNRLRYILKHIHVATAMEHHEVFIIDGCHSFPLEIWLEFCRIVEDPPPWVTFIFIVTNPATLPHSIMSQCKKYVFSRIAEADVVSRLTILCEKEDINIEEDALNLIASYSDGSLLEAEIMLDQLTLLGKRITKTLVKDLLGMATDEKLLNLLEAAMSSDNAETVKRSRELMDSGVDPVALMSQLAAILMDIMAGTYDFSSQQCSGALNGRRSLSEVEPERLQQAVKILSDGQGQLSLSGEQSTWFTAALLQLGSGHNLEHMTSSTTNKNYEEMNEDAANNAQSSVPRAKYVSYSPQDSSCSSSVRERMKNNLLSDVSSYRTLEEGDCSNERPSKKVSGHSLHKLENIWQRCTERCHLEGLRQFLAAHLKLVAIKQSEGYLIAYLAAKESKAKFQAERFFSSITNLVEMTLEHKVKVIIDLVPEFYNKSMPHATWKEHNNITNSIYNVDEPNLSSSSDEIHRIDIFSSPKITLDCSNGMLLRPGDISDNSQIDAENSSLMVPTAERNNEAYGTKVKGPSLSVKRYVTDEVHEQRLEKAWLEAEKGTIGFASHSRNNSNQTQWHYGTRNPCQDGLTRMISTPRKYILDNEIKQLKAQSSKRVYKREHHHPSDHYRPAFSPSLLHTSNFRADSATNRITNQVLTAVYSVVGKQARQAIERWVKRVLKYPRSGKDFYVLATAVPEDKRR
ncbi:protein STICHEL [Canna indica]|uniref:Protein STICHEL n=1 Tax=Canna indica TaxID=4628 RepID=A0AAQ3QLF3_9LILI|nr:protein STICHEL [Canna indica]